MIDEKWTLLFGIPIIVFLLALAARRLRALSTRIAEVQEEQARNPLPPFAQLANLMAEPEAPKARRGKKTDGNG